MTYAEAQATLERLLSDMATMRPRSAAAKTRLAHATSCAWEAVDAIEAAAKADAPRTGAA